VAPNESGSNCPGVKPGNVFQDSQNSDGTTRLEHTKKWQKWHRIRPCILCHFFVNKQGNN